MTTPPPGSPDLAPKTRDELVAMVAGAHSGSGYTDAALAGRTLAAQSKLPRVIAENLGAGFGQWTFFPEAAEIVDFALAYVPPSTEEDLWVLARSWAADDAAARHTLMALVGREIVQHELRRVDVAPLRQLLEETRPTPARALRPPPAAAPVTPTRMPKPELKRPAKAEAAPPSRRFVHPKFGEGVLASQDGAGPDAKLTIKFESGPKTLLARYVAEIPT
jgi:hypothetical protein